MAGRHASILGFVGFAPVRDMIVGNLGNPPPGPIERRLQEIKALGRAMASVFSGG